MLCNDRAKLETAHIDVLLQIDCCSFSCTVVCRQSFCAQPCKFRCLCNGIDTVDRSHFSQSLTIPCFSCFTINFTFKSTTVKCMLDALDHFTANTDCYRDVLFISGLFTDNSQSQVTCRKVSRNNRYIELYKLTDC